MPRGGTERADFLLTLSGAVDIVSSPLMQRQSGHAERACGRLQHPSVAVLLPPVFCACQLDCLKLGLLTQVWSVGLLP